METPDSKCFVYSMDYIYRYPKSAKDLTAKLHEKQFSVDDIEETMEYLEYKWYVNDADFAERYILSQCVNKWKSALWVENKLRQKSIDKDIIRGVLRTHKREIDKAISEYLQKTIAQIIEKWESTDKMIQKLRRQGYQYEQIKDAMFALGT